MSTLDFHSVTRATAAVVAAVRDDQLAGPTPCPAYSVGDLVDHVHGLSLAFTASARKERLEGGAPSADGDRHVALNEVVVHGWDLAVATGQPYAAEPAAVAACRAFVDSFEPPAGGQADDGGLFGPPVEVPAAASPLDHLVGAAGRRPGWTP